MRKINKDYLAMLLLAALCLSPISVLADEDMVLSRDAAGKQQETVSAPAQSTPASSSLSSLRVVGVWLLVLGAGGAGLVYASRRRRQALLFGKKESRLTVVERVALGGHRELLLIKACDRLLVVASQPDGMTLLSDLPNDTSPSLPFSNLLNQETAGLPPVPAAASMPAGLTRSALRASAFNLQAYADNMSTPTVANAPFSPGAPSVPSNAGIPFVFSAPQRNKFAPAPVSAPAWPEMESVS